MTITTTTWDAADHLDGKDAILAYFEAVFEDGNLALIAAALNDVARAKGLATIPRCPAIPTSAP